jgi:hypothetical protein
MQYSEDFTNAVWAIPNGGSSVVVTSNAITAPNGTITADKMEIANGANDRIEQINTAPILTSGLPCTFSVYIKSISGTGKVGIRSGQSGSSAVLSYTSEWQRLTWTFNAFANTEIPQFCNSTLVGGADSAPSFYVWGAQLNIGSTAKPYFPTTDRLNVPRLTYQNGGGGCPSLLLEKQSTNALQYSEDLTQSNWSKQNVIVTANATTSPDGTQNADKLIANTTDARHLIYQAVNTGIYTSTYSVFAKAGENSFLIMRLDTDVTEIKTWFNLSNGTIGTSEGGSPTIQSMGNGWYRCTVQFVSSASQTIYAVLYTAKTNGVQGFAGNDSDGTFFWGAQLEASSYATSYIPTTSASATRVADACFKTGASALIGQSEGTIFWEGNFSRGSGTKKLFSLNDGSSTNLVDVYTTADNDIQARVRAGANGYGVINTTVANSRFKLAYAYKNNDFVLYINGSQIGSVTSGSFSFSSPLTIIQVGDGEAGADELDGVVGEFVVFKTRISNTDLASLTA